MANLGADALRTRGRQDCRRRSGQAETDPAGSETSGMRRNTVSGTRETLHLAWHVCQVRTVNPRGTTVTHGCRESDRFIVPRKPSNKGGPQGPAEKVEGRELAKGNGAE